MAPRKMQVLQMCLSVKLSNFLWECECRNLSARTLEHYESAVQKFIGCVGDKYIGGVTQDDVTGFARHLKDQGHSPGGINHYLRGIRVFLNHCETGLQVRMLRSPKTEVTPFTEEQIRKLLAQPDQGTFTGLRDYVMMLVMFDTGVRVAELCGVCKRDIHGTHLAVTGKGDKKRIVPLGKYAQKVLTDYLRQVEDLPPEAPVFITAHNNPMDRSRFREKILKYGRAAGIEEVRLSPHTLRHSFARSYLLNGGDMYSLQSILGHETLEMSRRYVHLFQNDILKVHAKYSPSDRLFDKERRKLK